MTPEKVIHPKDIHVCGVRVYCTYGPNNTKAAVDLTNTQLEISSEEIMDFPTFHGPQMLNVAMRISACAVLNMERGNSPEDLFPGAVLPTDLPCGRDDAPAPPPLTVNPDPKGHLNEAQRAVDDLHFGTT